MHADLDWSMSITNVLFHLDSVSQTNPSSCLTYFEKLMVVRDLSRDLTQTNRLEEAILWFEDRSRPLPDAAKDIKTA